MKLKTCLATIVLGAAAGLGITFCDAYYTHCHRNDPKQVIISFGRVYKKDYTPAQTMAFPIISNINNMTSIQIMADYSPERYTLSIESDVDGIRKTREIEVSKEVWQKKSVGNAYP